jgi:hypothetical protein
MMKKRPTTVILRVMIRRISSKRLIGVVSEAAIHVMTATTTEMVNRIHASLYSQNTSLIVSSFAFFILFDFG